MREVKKRHVSSDGSGSERGEWIMEVQSGGRR
jgi:hypothetical protein